MAREYSVTQGSGLFPHHQTSTAVNEFGSIPEGTFPGSCKTDLRARTGEGAVILNPEDFSINLGLRQQAIIVGTSAVALPENPLTYRRALVIHNSDGNNTIYIGGSDVTVANGFPLTAGEKIAIDIQGNPNVTIYAISDAGGQNVRILELS